MRKYYIFTVLSRGLRSACRAFTYLTRELVGKWRANGGASVPHVHMAEIRQKHSKFPGDLGDMPTLANSGTC